MSANIADLNHGGLRLARQSVQDDSFNGCLWLSLAGCAVKIDDVRQCEAYCHIETLRRTRINPDIRPEQPASNILDGASHSSASMMMSSSPQYFCNPVRTIVTLRIQARAGGSQPMLRLPFCPYPYFGCLLAMFWCGCVSAEEIQPSRDTQSSDYSKSTDEVSVVKQRQTQLRSEVLSISETPDAEPHVNGISGVAGLAALSSPAYDGSKKTKTSPFPYVDIHGFFNDRMYLSSVRGIGVNLLDLDRFRGGFALNYAGGRTSKDDPRLTGLPDIGGAAQVGGFLTYSLKPFALEMRVRRRLGSTAGTQFELGASVAAAPLPRLYLSLGASMAWADSSLQKTFFGVTPAQAAQATLQGNPLTPYTPKAGLTTAGLTAVGVYQVGSHWGLIGRITLQDLIGSQVKNSPLTQRTLQPGVAFGAAYQF